MGKDDFQLLPRLGVVLQRIPHLPEFLGTERCDVAGHVLEALAVPFSVNPPQGGEEARLVGDAPPFAQKLLLGTHVRIGALHSTQQIVALLVAFCKEGRRRKSPCLRAATRTSEPLPE